MKLIKNRQKFIQKHIYYIGYITVKSISDYESTDSVNPLYFIVGEVNWYSGEKMQINT